MMDQPSVETQSPAAPLCLSFSGGGFRAAFFCLGAYRRLVECGISASVTRLSAVSGGSLVAGKIAIEASRAQFSSVEDFDARVTRPMIKLGRSGLRRRIMLHWRPWRRARSAFSEALVSLLDESLFGGIKMSQLTNPTEVIINATSLHTGKRFRFKRSDIGDSTYGVTTDMEDITVAFAVACSASFPMLFAAMPLDTTGRTFFGEYWDTHRRFVSRPPRLLWLTDGGVYDNLGSEPVLRAPEPFLVIDASKFAEPWNTETQPTHFARTWRPLETGLDQIVSLRRRLLFERAQRHGGLLLMLRDPISLLATELRHGRFGFDNPPPLADIRELPLDIQTLLSLLRTDLDAFHQVEIECLLWAGAARMDVAIRRYMRPGYEGKSASDVVLPSFDADMMRKVLNDGQKRTTFGRAA